jgi:hypothetical protein
MNDYATMNQKIGGRDKENRLRREAGDSDWDKVPPFGDLLN